MTTPREIHQTFIRTPGLELRSTWQSTQAYKRHSHAQLSIGAILEGNTRCICQDQEYLLAPGDLIVIPANAPHSCNPVQGQPRSYHMLYIDTPLPFAQQVLRDDALFSLYLNVANKMSPTALEALRCVENAPKLRLLPFRSVGTASGLLLGYTAEHVRIGCWKAERVTVALSPTPVSEGQEYDALWGGPVE